MKVYDVWCSDIEDVVEGWVTAYGDDMGCGEGYASSIIDDLIDYMDKEFPGSDWIIIENDLPF